VFQFIDKKLLEYRQQKKNKKILKRLSQLQLSPTKVEHNEKYVAFSHIGLIGDIVFSIPAMLAIAKIF